jgi:hypothetical protein
MSTVSDTDTLVSSSAITTKTAGAELGRGLASDPAVAVDPAPSPEGHDENEESGEDGGHPSWSSADRNPVSPQQVQADEQGSGTSTSR